MPIPLQNYMTVILRNSEPVAVHQRARGCVLWLEMGMKYTLRGGHLKTLEVIILQFLYNHLTRHNFCQMSNIQTPPLGIVFPIS